MSLRRKHVKMFDELKYTANKKDIILRKKAVDADESQAQEIISGFPIFDTYMKNGFAIIKEGIKISNSLPCEDNFKYYTCFSSFNSARRYQTDRILKLIQSIIEATGIVDNITRRDIEEKLDLLVEANDIFLDRANACINEEFGFIRNSELELILSQTKKSVNVNGSWNTLVNRQLPASKNSSVIQSIRLLGAKNVQRPQLTFTDTIDNSAEPWQPRITEKPNALKPLDCYLEGKSEQVFGHPYEFELDVFQVPQNQLEKRLPIKYKPLEETPLIIIDKEEDLTVLLNDLLTQNEIAIDLEHHSYRSFQGITCLMQISTRHTDYIIDTLALRSELYKLNEIFTKPTILKVFHGADSDIQWLQRDLSLYVLNMFDTYQAAKQLELPYLSLAYLLKIYCDLEPNKQFQLADWRIRPLPQELLKYAREDTHYLLYVKDIMQSALIDAANGHTNILNAVYSRSTEVCKKKYVKSVWTEESYIDMYRKSQKMFNNRQLFALKELHKWRDQTAREEDDSINYVLPNHMLLNIAETLPREMQGILACCNPIPPLVRQNLLRLHKIILRAREQPIIKPVLEEDIRQRMTQRSHLVHSEIWIYSSHDTPHGTEPRADLPCLLNSRGISKMGCFRENIEHSITVFDNAFFDDNDAMQKEHELYLREKLLFVSPFERYKRVIPFIADIDAKGMERQLIEGKKDKSNRLTALEKNSSMNRVHDHFKLIIENEDGAVIDVNVPLNQMHGKKRKMNSNVVNNQTNYKSDLHPPKKTKTQAEDIFQPLRSREKGGKKVAEKDLKAKGMLPSEDFNYKAVDFSSFQGGSKTTEENANFRQIQAKKWKGGRFHRKQK